MLKQLARGLLFAAVCAGCPSNAATDPLPAKQDVAGARSQPEFDPVNIRLGPWILAPALRIDSGYDDNLFGTASSKVGDGFAIFAPSLKVNNDWGQGGVDLAASGIFTRYFRHGRQHSNEFNLGGAGHIEFGRMRLSASVARSLTSERHGTNGAPLSVGKPSQFYSFSQKIQIAQDLSPVRLSMQAEHGRISYADLEIAGGGRASQAFRDSTSWTFRGGALYQPTDLAAIGLFAQYQRADSPISTRANTLWNVGASGAIDLGLIRIESEAGYLRHGYKNSAFRNFHGFAYSGHVSWYPTPLLTVSLSGRRTLENSGVPSVGVIVSRSAKAEIEYELLRNLLVQLSASRKWQNYREIRSQATSHNEELTGEYRFNRTVAIGAYAKHECRDSANTAVIRNFCATLAGLSLTLRR
ncbi:MAG: outer membrane beta-barrel protein [Sphingobium sp.]|jgi:hypothetical protein|nr:outer membrane beta-barrel protein [Sphingobium sp.]MCI1270876.1 outer membrane beta-barrel protein [Sphingobium sp.]MCI1755773.1 outer membrane beta-barrel protein [Sphingobium sp.]MCI2053077.1 outer membrane beta-barrel protein [Sphingobium sp.]